MYDYSISTNEHLPPTTIVYETRTSIFTISVIENDGIYLIWSRYSDLDVMMMSKGAENLFQY